VFKTSETTNTFILQEWNYQLHQNKGVCILTKIIKDLATHLGVLSLDGTNLAHLMIERLQHYHWSWQPNILEKQFMD